MLRGSDQKGGTVKGKEGTLGSVPYLAETELRPVPVQSLLLSLVFEILLKHVHRLNLMLH